jgi:hypothetical protein
MVIGVDFLEADHIGVARLKKAPIAWQRAVRRDPVSGTPLIFRDATVTDVRIIVPLSLAGSLSRLRG